MDNQITRFNKQALATIEHIGLLVIAIATVVAMADEVWLMVRSHQVKLADLLLLFIYLEVLTMVSLYYGSGKLPVRFPLYIGMVALARYLILDMKEMDGLRILAVTGAVLMLALAVLAIRYGHIRFPYAGQSELETPLQTDNDK
jgi:protein PsiE